MKFVKLENGDIREVTAKGCIREFDGKTYAFIEECYAYRKENGTPVLQVAEDPKDLVDFFFVKHDFTRDFLVAQNWAKYSKTPIVGVVTFHVPNRVYPIIKPVLIFNPDGSVERNRRGEII